ncbi:MAG: serine hydrolase [Chthoniobacter sp.]|nr:serine hydrolase [Chthoniobacter sp.]
MFFSRFLPFLALAAIASTPVSAQAPAAYVISDSTTGFILEQSAGTKKRPVASLTKIAMAMVVLDWSTQTKADLSQLATVPESVAQLGPSQGVGFQPGDQCSLRDLLYAALLQSDNVAAQTIAEHIGRQLKGPQMPPTDAFVAQMNALARQLGMLQTRFVNAHGLDHLERTVPYSTAADLAKLTSYAMANSAFRFYVSQRERKITLTTAAAEPSAYLLRNTNELLGTNAIDGVKTGATGRAGQCVILSAAKAPDTRQQGTEHIITPRRLNIVVLGSADRFRVASGLLQRGWNLYDSWAAAGRPLKGWRPAP